MKKVLLFIVTFLFAMTVNAKYKEYNIGEVVVINDRPYMVVSNSDSANSKLVLMDYDYIYVSNYDELYDECSIDVSDYDYVGGVTDKKAAGAPTVLDNKCVVEHANFCRAGETDCYELGLSFETKKLDYENNEELTYDENSETNIGYFFKNRLDAYYKDLMGLNSIKTRLLTADELIAIANSVNMIYGGQYMVQFGQMQDSCVSFPGGGVLLNDMKNINKSTPNGGSFDYNPYNFGRMWINSLKYTKDCYMVTGGVDEYINMFPYFAPSGVKAVIEISKTELDYELTKEVEGNGSLEVEATDNRTYDAGETVIVNDQAYVIIANNNGELKLLSVAPVGVSNYDELYDSCNNIQSDVEYYNCVINKAKYCTPSIFGSYGGQKDKAATSSSCEVLYMTYNYDDSNDETYNPNKENNIAHYVKNELTNELKKTFGNNITVDVLTIEELDGLVQNGVMCQGEPAGIPASAINGVLRKGTSNICSDSIIGNMYYAYYDSNININSELNNGSSGREYNADREIYPVVTINKDELSLYVKASTTVKVTATPEEGYELVELKVTDDDNKTITYNPGQITRVGESHYTFTMPAADTNVFAKFVKYERFNAKSLTPALVVEDGLNRAEGDTVEFSLTLEEDEYLDKIVYYDNENNEIEVPFEKTGNGYRLTMPANDVFIEAVVKTNSTSLYGLFGDDIEIPTPKGKAGNILTFTVTGDKKVESITFKKEDGSEIAPYYSVQNGVYSVVMPEEDVYVEVNYLADVVVPVPKTGDTINRTFIVLAISVIVAIGCGYILVKNNKKKSFN